MTKVIITGADQTLKTSGMLVLVGALLSGPAAMIVVAVVSPQPAWIDVNTFVDHYHPVQTIPYLLGFILLTGFVLFSASCHAVASPSHKPRTSAALVFTGIYAALVFTNYTIQLGYIPRVLKYRPEYLSVITMANPESFAWFLEMFGYAAMGVATWLVSPIFVGNLRADLIRYMLITNGVVSIIGAVCTALYDGWVFTIAGLVSFLAWNLLVPACFLLIAKMH